MKHNRYVFILLAIILACTFFFHQYTCKKENENRANETLAKVLAVDNSGLISASISHIGYQALTVEITEGIHKGEVINATNSLAGKKEFDNYFEADDKIYVSLYEENGEMKKAVAIDLYRQGWLLILFAFFAICLIFYAKFIGFKALLSFILTFLVIWKILLPGLLNGKNPLVLSTLVLVLITSIIIYSVAGFTKKGISAFVGSTCGFLITISITVFFGQKLSLFGMTAPYAETLLFSGHIGLNMQHIFYAAIIIGASGAAMDIAMDISASMSEIKIKKPDISTCELIQSGLTIGRAVIGTMTTTLLLAYSGGYLTLLMLFMTKNTSLIHIINLKIVVAEIMRTVVGSIGLVIVAPVTAYFSGWIMGYKKKIK